MFYAISWVFVYIWNCWLEVLGMEIIVGWSFFLFYMLTYGTEDTAFWNFVYSVGFQNRSIKHSHTDKFAIKLILECMCVCSLINCEIWINYRDVCFCGENCSNDIVSCKMHRKGCMEVNASRTKNCRNIVQCVRVWGDRERMYKHPYFDLNETWTWIDVHLYVELYLSWSD